jgi:replication factor C subunit 3/5
MLLIDKYRPISQEEMFFHKDLVDLLSVMSKDEAIPHIIFYGPDGSGKKTIIRLFLELLFDKSVHKVRDTSYKVVGSGNKITIEKVKQSNYHIVIDPKNNNFDRYLIHDIVKEYAKRRSLNIFKTKRAFKVVLINNLDGMSYYAQTALRRTMERYNDKCRFIMWCKSLSKVINPLQSRCICLRVPSPNNLELFQYIFKISVYEKILLELNQYAEIVARSEGNIKKALWDLEFYRFNYDFDTDYCESLDKIVVLILELKIENVIKIRDIINNLTITNFDGATIMSDLIDALCVSDKISDSSKQQIVYESAEIEYQLVKGRRHIIQFDALITSVMRILYDETLITT